MKMSNTIKLLIVCILINISACYSQSKIPTRELPKKEIVLTLHAGPNNPRNSEGDFITLKSGRILFIYSHYTGNSYMDHAPAYLASRYSDDNGKTWSKTDQLVVAQEGKQNVMSVSLLRLNNGQIALFYLKKDSDDYCMPLVRFSSDEGKTWSEPRHCVTDRTSFFNLHNDRVIQLRSGRIMWTAEASMRMATYYSDDNGQTWKASKLPLNPDGKVNTEPAVAELKNGNIIMIMRTDTTTQYVSYSSDKSESWSPTRASNIISASNSPASITRIPATGDLLLVWNNNNNMTTPALKAKRTPLNTAVSKDDGKTWENINVVEDNPRGSFCYTAIHFVGNDVLLGYFDWSTRAMTVTKVNLNWIYNNQTITSN